MTSLPSPSQHDPVRQLTLVKQDQRWVFRYARGEEQQMMQRLASEANDPASRLDWFDVAVLSHQMGEHLAAKLETLKDD